jgi:hypothetical protein
MTECTQSSFEFQAHFSRQVLARFDGGAMTCNGGAVLLRETDRRLNLLARLATCVEDHRQPWLVSHTVGELVAQRVYARALGYEDLTDYDQLREDPLLGVLSGKPRVGQEPLAGKSTLNRLELGGEAPSRHKKIRYRLESGPRQAPARQPQRVSPQPGQKEWRARLVGEIGRAEADLELALLVYPHEQYPAR